MTESLLSLDAPPAAPPAAGGPADDDPHVAGIEAAFADGADLDEAELLRRLRDGLNAGRAAIRVRFEADGVAASVLRDHTLLIDRLVRRLLDRARRRYPVANPTTGDRLAVLAIGGYGRAELAPQSDIDLLFLLPYKRTPHAEQVIEYLLYKLWDLGLKVGHATRSVGECVRAARADVTIGTSLLEARLIWGHSQPFDDLRLQFERDVIAGNGATFVEAKMAERDARHQRVGDSRYLLEPNVKEGKGGLRDLHTLFWLGRFLYRIEDPLELTAHGVLSAAALRAFIKAERFLWAVRCHLHYLTGRAEERLTFDLQPEVARRMGYRDTPNARGVERFMKHYYRVAKEVGSLTRIFCAALEEQHKRQPRLSFVRFGLGRRRIDGFTVQGGRVAPAEPDLFERQPVAMLRLFHLAQERDLDIHPLALRGLTQNLHRIDHALRRDRTANALFLAMLTSPKNPATTLTRMNEAGLLGRFVPEFGRVVAQMQHDLYHVYTVDEHTVRAIGELNRIERGELADELPLATELMPKVLSRTELFVATLLHDIGKGLGGDHSERGARIAERLCPRLGLSDEQTETVVWLVRHHLLLSRTAFKRDLEDPKTVADLVEAIQSPERLRLLLILTAADIRAVGPNAWNGWKGQLLRALYHEVDAVLAGGDPGGRRRARVEAARARLRERLPDWPDAEFAAYVARHDAAYWTAFSTEDHRRHAELIRAADREKRLLVVNCHVDRFRARTGIELYAPDHPGLFMKVAGALAISGASIVDARVFTTADGMAFDMFGVQDAAERTAVAEPRRLARMREAIEKALAGELRLDSALAGRTSPLPKRTEVFHVEPRVLIDDAASRTHTVIELNGRDRPGLLYELAKALKDLGLVISSAHISTYGERVVDVFYVKDVFGLKLTPGPKLRRVQRHLLDALAGEGAADAPGAVAPGRKKERSH